MVVFFSIFFYFSDIGRDSDLKEFRVKKGDIIVMSSDGLFDVLTDQEVERVVNSHNPKVSVDIK
jgi:serine/threonine protein phosphatase PrpC